MVVIIVSLVLFVLGTLAFLTNQRSRPNRVFFALCGVISLYTIINYLADADPSRALFWVHCTFGLAVLMLYFALHFINLFPKPVIRQPFNRLSALVMLAMVGISFSPLLVPAITRMDGISNVVSGPLYGLYLGYVTVALITIILIVLHSLHTNTSSLDRVRATYVLVGFGSTGAILALTNLILPEILGNNAVSILGGAVAPLIFIIFISVAIIRHRLFNIRLIVARSATYILLLLTLGLGYGTISFTVSATLLSTATSPTLQRFANTVIALVLAFSFQPLRRLFERVTNRIFFRYHYDSQVVLNDFSKIIVSELHLDRMLKQALTQLCDSLHIQFAQIIVYNNDHVYRIEHYGPLPRRLMVAPELAQLDKSILVADELANGDRKNLMESHGIRVALTLRTREEFIGHLLLGDKLSGDIYADQDIELLEIIAKELAVAIQNAKAYAVIQDFNLTLQARIERATNRLRVANRHLKELDHAKDEFISMASHQLRTPLTTIKGYLSMMQEGDAGKLNKAQAEFTNYAFGASERMVNLISDLLNVSRMSAGRFLIQTHPTDMVRMIDDEVRQLQSHAKAKGLELLFDHPVSPLPLVEIDEGKTRQVIMNFIDNAIYYTKQGHVRVILQQTGNHVRLEVRDTGIGVPSAARKQLFTKFYRAENAQVIRPDGTGLGLYLAKRVVEDQGGTIIFSSTEGQGSTFGFELPLKPSPLNHKEKPHARAHH